MVNHHALCAVWHTATKLATNRNNLPPNPTERVVWSSFREWPWKPTWIGRVPSAASAPIVIRPFLTTKQKKQKNFPEGFFALGLIKTVYKIFKTERSSRFIETNGVELGRRISFIEELSYGCTSKLWNSRSFFSFETFSFEKASLIT